MLPDGLTTEMEASVVPSEHRDTSSVATRLSPEAIRRIVAILLRSRRAAP